MPPAVRRVSLQDALAAFAAQAAVILGWAPTADLTVGSAVGAWTVRDVLAHLTLSLEPVADVSPGRGAAVPVSEFVGSYTYDAAEAAKQPATLPGSPLKQLAARCAAVNDRASWPATVSMWDTTLTTAEAIATRVLELVVHGDDLGIAPAPVALGLVCRLLTGVLATRHPGRAVELRVAPYAAVQVLEGTVHRRGTPTAVVSCDPLPWVRLATGRLSWAEAAADGVLTARGERSDLSAYLPLLS